MSNMLPNSSFWLSDINVNINAPSVHIVWKQDIMYEVGVVTVIVNVQVLCSLITLNSTGNGWMRSSCIKVSCMREISPFLVAPRRRQRAPSGARRMKLNALPATGQSPSCRVAMATNSQQRDVAVTSRGHRKRKQPSENCYLCRATIAELGTSWQQCQCMIATLW